MLYYTPGDAIVTKSEFFEKIHEGELSRFAATGKKMDLSKAISFSTGELTTDNAVPFQPIGIGKPLTIMIRQIYTGKYPKSLFGSSKSMLTTSAVKSITSFEEKPRALNFMMENVSSNNVIERPAAVSQGTPFVFYSPALVENSLTMDLSIVFDTFPQPVFDQVGSAFQAAAGIPVFLPYTTYMLGLSGIVKLAGVVGESVFDGKPAFSTSDGLNFFLPGSIPVPSGFALITDKNVDSLDPEFREKYHVDKYGQVVDKSGIKYKGDIPFIVISLDGSTQKELESFIPTAATAAMLSRFYGIKDGQQQNLDNLINAVKIFNDFKYRTQVDALDTEIEKCTVPAQKEEMKKKRDALAKNIITDLLKKS
ncbi:MAG: hypothetical protein Q7V05_10740 [Methanoregula sp.]|nr:hypothetical protein [Methanoregula sp.]